MKIKHYFFAIIFILLGTCLILVYGFYKRIPRKTWVINNVQMLSSNIHPGSEIAWTVDVCRYTNKEYIAVNYVLNTESNDAVLVTRRNDLDISKGECKELIQTGIIPLHASPGESKLFIRLTTRDTPSELFPPVEATSQTFNITK